MSGRSHEEGLKDLTLLGNQGTQYSFEYAPEVLEAVDNLHPDRDYFVKFNCPEFTSLCPLRISRILQRCTFRMSRIKKLSRVNH